MSRPVLSAPASWARRGIFLVLAVALALPVGALLADRVWGSDVLLIAPYDASVVALNRSLWSPADPVADLYGSPMSETTRVLLWHEGQIIHPAEDPRLALLPTGDAGRRPLQTRTVWWAVRLAEAGLGALAVVLAAGSRGRRRRRAAAA
jgi:hypothetical protein